MKQYVLQLLQGILSEMQAAGKLQDIPGIEVGLPELAHGDYFTNVAMRLASQLKANPNAIATDLAEKLTAADQAAANKFESVQAAGGFINFKLSGMALAERTTQLKAGEFMGGPKIGEGKKVVFEYSSPNTNKPLHIGHVRNDVYGKACINLLQALGYDVTTCEIINDRGIHIMKSVLMYMKFGDGQNPEQAGMKPDHFVGHFYKMFGEKSSVNQQSEQELNDEAQELLRRWEAGDQEVRALWEKMNAWFFEGVKETYEKEGTTFDEVDFESEIYDKGRDLVMSGVEKGIFQQEKDGSVSVSFPEEHLGKKYLLRKDGTTIYITQDMYLWDLRNRRHSPDLAIVTTASEQSYHFEVLRRIFELLEYPWSKNFRHLPYEHVYLGKDKMSSRSGNAITSDGLLESVKDRVKQTMATLERLKGSADDEALVESIAYGAIKYGYLHYEPQTRIYFDIEQTISLEGNTGPYIQYAHARIKSIFEKAGEAAAPKIESLSGEPELNLMRLLNRYENAIIAAASEYKPNLLCNYLHELASAFNGFYNDVPIIKESDPKIRIQRLALLEATANVLSHGLGLLGITAPERM